MLLRLALLLCCAAWRLEAGFISPICTYGSDSGQTNDVDCNPDCWPRWSTTRCDSAHYHDGFSGGTKNNFANGCLSWTGAHSCDCYSHSTGDTTCSCGSSTMNQYKCYRQTISCTESPCAAGQQLKRGCGCSKNGDGYDCDDGCPLKADGSGGSDCSRVDEKNTWCMACPSGTYQIHAHSVSQCLPYSNVPATRYWDGQQSGTLDAGAYNTIECPKGNRCPGGPITDPAVRAPIPCTTGYKSDGNSAACTMCSMDQTCTSATSSDSTPGTVLPCDHQALTTIPETSCSRLCIDFRDHANSRGSQNFQYYVRPGYKLVSTSTDCWTWRACDAGMYASTMRTSPSGLPPSTDLMQCTACAAGSYSIGGAVQVCTPCKPGSYQNATGASTCMWCPVGTASRLFGATACELCPRGTSNAYTNPAQYDEAIATNPKSVYCDGCQVGSYASGLGATACTPAASGFYVPNPRAVAQLPCQQANQTCMQMGTSFTDAYGKHTLDSMEGQCGAKEGDTMDVGASWIWKDGNAYRYCGFCRAGQYLNKTSQTCQDCLAGSYCLGIDGVGMRPCTPWNASWLGTRWISEACKPTQDTQLSECRPRKSGEYIVSECTPSEDRHSAACKTCGIDGSSPYHDFLHYIVTPCGQYSDTQCGICNASDRLVGGLCNPCPSGTRFANKSCVLCATGAFCNASAPTSTSSRSLLAAAGRWLLDLATPQQTVGEFACPAGTISGPGADADHCLPNCGLGFFSRDAKNESCAPVSSPSLKRVAWYISGQDAVAALQLGAPRASSYVIARNPSVSNPHAGELLLIGPDNQASSLAGSPFTAASAPPSSTEGSPTLAGTSARLGRIFGMAANVSQPVTRLVFSELIGQTSLLRVVDLTGVSSMSQPVVATLWSAGSAPVAASQLMRIAPNRVYGEYYFVADQLANCVWSVRIRAQTPATWTPVVISGITLTSPTAVATDVSADQNIIYLAVLDANVLVVCELMAGTIPLPATTSISCYTMWTCGGGNQATSSGQPPMSCSSMKVSNGPAVDIALVPRTRGSKAYILTTDEQATLASDGAQRDGVAIIDATAIPATLSWAISLSSPINFGQGAAFGMLTDFILTTGPTAWGASVQAMGLHGCLCAAGLYCLNGQCVASPAGTYSDDWAMAPTKCPPGSAGNLIGATSLTDGCKLCACPSCSAGMTSYEWGAVNCIPQCDAATPVYSPTQHACLAGCNSSLGLYREEVAAGSACKPCPAGTRATSLGVGIDACIRCSFNEYYVPATKQCATCPNGTTTLVEAAEVCMPLVQTPCDDGLATLHGGSGCASASDERMPTLFGANVTALHTTPAGVLYIAKSDGTIWRWGRSKPASAATAAATLVTTYYATPSVIMAASADGQTVYSATRAATCIRVFSSSSSSSSSSSIGDCTQVGQLGYIVSVALIEQQNYNSLLAVASRVVWQGVTCHAVFTVSLYNQQIQAIMHYDVALSPIVRWTECRSDPIMLSPAINGGLYVVWKSNINFFNVDTLDELAQYPGPTQAVSATFALPSGGLLLAEQLSKNIDLIPAPSSPSLVRIATNLTYAVENLVGAGNHFWYTQAGVLVEGLLPIQQGCAAGFVLINSTRTCTQVGHGTYSTDGLSIQHCHAGTYGAMAGGGTIRDACVMCPLGTISTSEASVGCTACALGQVASVDGTACLATCGAASYQDMTTSACIACPTGYTTTALYARAATDCVPCPANTYVDQSTQGRCIACPTGTTSLKGSHHCVTACSAADGTCAARGDTCASTTNKYATMTQLKAPTYAPIDIAVEHNGGVFFTDGTSIRYYVDTCASDQICDVMSSTPIATGLQRVSALAFSNAAVPVTTAAGTNSVIRYLYYAEQIQQTVRRLSIVYSGDAISGVLDKEATTGTASVLIAGQSKKAGFSEGPCLTSSFNMITDMEITQLNNGATLFVMDALNYRMRRIDMMSDSTCTTSTLLMNGETNWNTALHPIYNIVLYGFALSADETTLYLAIPSMNKIVSIVINTGETSDLCALNSADYHNDQPSTATAWCHSMLGNNQRPCMLRSVYDVAVADSTYIYAVYTQGVTQIDLSARPSWAQYGAQCMQVSGVQNDFYIRESTGLRDGYILQPTDSSISTSTINSVASQYDFPYQIAYASSSKILYIADVQNAAIRRIYVKTDCTCAPGFVYIASARTCYNPSPNWNMPPLPVCNPGFYALDGESTCTHSCSQPSDDVNHAAARVCVRDLAAAAASPSTYSFKQVLGSSILHTSDWYGYPQHQMSSEFDSIPKDSTLTAYHVGATPGRAPSGGEFVTLTWSAFAQLWEVEYDWTLQPTLLTSGLWYPCSEALGTQSKDTYTCSSSMFSFEMLSPEKPNLVPARWEALRIGAYEQAAVVLSDTTTSLYNLSMGMDMGMGIDADSRSRVSLFSRFYIFGSDLAVPSICGDTEGGGPCFTVMRHVNSNDIPVHNALPNEELEIAPSYDAWMRAGCTTRSHAVCNASGYVGWPAHYACPDGYMWLGPGKHTTSLQDLPTGLTSQIACISCLPGFYSSTNAAYKRIEGGPYSCRKCEPGTYASAVGAAFCTECPTGTYSSMYGSSSCTRCNHPNWTMTSQTTLWPACYSIEQCTGCEPGTGSCSGCLLGGYQSDVGQAHCLPAPIGSMSPDPSAKAAIPCPTGTYTNRVGQTACEHCSGQHEYTTSDVGATGCATCMATCALTVDNVCGRGCGLNKYWDGAACVVCAYGTFNGDYPCATTAEACLDTPRGDLYVPQGQNLSMTTPLPCPRGQVASLDWKTCVDCIPGSYSDGSPMRRSLSSAFANATCHKCAPGTFGNASGMSVCYQCAPGSYTSVLGSTACTPCPLGKQCAAWGTGAPQGCPPGSYGASTGLTRCTLCDNNTASSMSNRTSACEACNADMNLYSPAPGGINCRPCEGTLAEGNCNACGLGRYFQSDTRLCLSCPDGTVNLLDIWATDASVCVPCASPTTYAAATTHDVCIEADPGFMPNDAGTGQRPCLPGTYRQTNMSYCASCPAGFYADASGTVSCTPCLAGRYASDPGSTACVRCDAHMYSWNGASACSVCAAGSAPTNASSACGLCPINYASDDGRLCTPCPMNMYAAAGRPCAYCPVPFRADAGFCSLCPSGTIATSTPSGGVYSECTKVTAVGYICPNAGSTSLLANCTQCSPPYTPNSTTRAQCELCGGGKTVVTKGAPCTNCPLGTFTPDGRACVVCPAGTFAASVGLSACTKCPTGRYRTFSNSSSQATSCTLCPVGTYGNVTGLTGCLTCTSALGWAGSQGQEQCSARRLSCDPGSFVNRTDEPTRDNVCVPCTPCAANEFVYNTTTSQQPSLITPPSSTSTILYTAANLCTGNGFAPGYTCLDPSNPKWMLGYRVLIGQAGSTQDGVVDGQQFGPCNDISGIRFLMDYTPPSSCPRPVNCYVSCRYGLQANAINYYTSLRTASLTLEPDSPANNVFLLDNILLLEPNQLLQICSPYCMRGECPFVGFYRPQVRPAYVDAYVNMSACGPPCAIAGQCAASNEGCSETCTNLPDHATFRSGAAGVGNSTGCAWVCNVGWHRNRDDTACDSCMQDNATSYCNSVNFALKTSSADCTPMMHPSDVCVPCQRIDHSTPPTWQAGSGCQYACDYGYYFSNSPAAACLPCNNATLVAACPMGTYLNISTCNTQHVAPVCSNCTTPFTTPDHVQFITNGGLSSTECRAVCNTWYHTYDNNVRQNLAVANWNSGVQSAYLECKVCDMYDSQTCGRVGCLKGNYRDVAVPENQTGACKLCKLSADCAVGQYAKGCTGNNTADASCQACPPLPYNRIYVAYGMMASVVTSGDCPSTCANNFVLDMSSGSGGGCVLCARPGCSMTAPADGQPSECAYRYSIWNAPPTVPWWDVSIMPARFKQYDEYRQPRKSGTLWEAAATCWPCPYGTNVQAGDKSLCILMDGFGRIGSLPTTTTSIPVLTSDMIAVFTKEPRPHLAGHAARRLLALSPQTYKTITLRISSSSQHHAGKRITELATLQRNALFSGAGGGRRSLLSAVATMDETLAVTPAACPIGSFKPTRGEAYCQLCPSGRSTGATQSISIASCQCLPGHTPVANSSICVPCPVDTFLAAESSTCVPCPQNQTTWGNTASSRCSCGLGHYRIDNGQCAVCPTGSYCVTCLESDTSCPSTGVAMLSCFPGASSPEGSSSLEQCVCLNNMQRVQIAPQYYICRMLPFGSRVVQGHIVCNDGWITNHSQAGGDVVCTLCNPGAYAMALGGALAMPPQPKIPVSCTLCPLHTFASSSVAIGGCTPCPSQQFTRLVGASSVNQCTCPDGQTKSNIGTCIGCTSSQYFDNSTRQCMPCPTHTIAPTGATDVSQCQCTMGYARSGGIASSACDLCPTGTYYISPSAPCQPCPIGSTTAGPGSIDRRACGRTSDLCASGYVYRNTGGCYPIQ